MTFDRTIGSTGPTTMTAGDGRTPAYGGLTCPVEHHEEERVLLGHGSGGRLSGELLAQVIAPALVPVAPGPPVDDAAVLDPPGLDTGSLAFTTDAYVVSPRSFPGGSIGELAVNGTVNDLAMMGARPLALSLAYIVEEGLPLAELREVTAAVARAAARAEVRVVTGDTKVVGRGGADGLYVVTSGLGVTGRARPCAARAAAGDVVLLSGPLAAHGMAVMGAREDFGFEASIRSDTQPLHRLVADVLAAAPATHTLRDPTRGGLAAALNEIASVAGVGIELAEERIPVADEVRAACDLLGLDPLQVANEGVCVAFVPPWQADAALAAMRHRSEGADAVRIGHVTAARPGRVVMRTLVGSERIVDPLVGEQLPRIC